MSYLGEYRGRRKSLPSIKLIPNGSGSADLYKDGTLVGTVTYNNTVWTELFSAAQNTMTTNMIEIFDSTGDSGFLGTGAVNSEVVFIQIVPGGNGLVTARIDSNIRIVIRPSATPVAGSEIIINFYD